jgi:hypothetical protein
MTQTLTDYAAKLAPFDDALLNFLRTSESIQDLLHCGGQMHRMRGIFESAQS